MQDLTEALYTAVRRAHHLRNVQVHSNCDKAGLVLLSHLYEHGALRLSDLAVGVHLDPSTVSRQVRALCDGGFAESLDDPDDKRARRLQITRRGRAELESVRHELGAILGGATRDWPKQDVQTLTSLLARLAEDLTAGSAPAATSDIA